MIGRLLWLIPVFVKSKQHPWVATFELATIFVLVELLRRWMWALIRIENEQVSNLEKYRYILAVPELDSVNTNAQSQQNYSNHLKKLAKTKTDNEKTR